MRTFERARLAVLLALPFAALIDIGCSSGDGPTGGPVTGALDTHCRNPDNSVNATVVGECMTGAAPADAAAPEPDDGGAPTSDYGETLFNAEGDDDDCKYHVTWTSTAVRANNNVTFNLTLTKLADGAPATGAGVRAEVFLTETHPAQPPPAASESSGGKYAVGPIKFDASGDWTVRFHFYENCNDAPEDSPHGHAAFFVHVP